MKRTLSLLLMLVMLCACLPLAQASAVYSLADWYGMGISALEEMAPETVQMAVSYFGNAGTYEQAVYYMQYAQCLSEILGMDSASTQSMAMTKYRLRDLQQFPDFTASLAEHRFAACGDLLTYVEARELESAGHYAQAWRSYLQIPKVLDAMSRRYDLIPKVYEEGKTLYNAGNYAGAAEALEGLFWEDSEVLYQRAYAEAHPTPAPTPEPTPTPTPASTPDPTPTPKPTLKTSTATLKATVTPKPEKYPMLFSISADQLDQLFYQMMNDAKTWTEETAPQTIKDIPLLPNHWLETIEICQRIRFSFSESGNNYVIKLIRPNPFPLIDGIENLNCSIAFLKNGSGFETGFNHVEEYTYTLPKNQLGQEVTNESLFRLFKYGDMDYLSVEYFSNSKNENIIYDLEDPNGQTIRWRIDGGYFLVYFFGPTGQYKSLQYNIDTGKLIAVWD